MQVEITSTKLGANEAYALYGIRVNQSPACYRRFTEFLVLSDKLNKPALASKLPSKLGFWQSSISPQVIAERKVKLEAFLRAALQQCTETELELVYNFISYSPPSGRGEQELLLEQQVHALRGELEQTRIAQQLELEASVLEVNEKVDRVLGEKLLLEQTLVEEGKLKLELAERQRELETSLVEERAKQQDEAKTVVELKRQRGLLELEIARLEQSQKSASEYGSQMSTKLSKAQTQNQKHLEEVAKLQAQHQAQMAVLTAKVQELEKEVAEAGEIKLKLALRVDELLALAGQAKQ